MTFVGDSVATSRRHDVGPSVRPCVRAYPRGRRIFRESPCIQFVRVALTILLSDNLHSCGTFRFCILVFSLHLCFSAIVSLVNSELSFSLSHCQCKYNRDSPCLLWTCSTILIGQSSDHFRLLGCRNLLIIYCVSKSIKK